MTANVRMIDVSSNNHPTDAQIDWAQVKAAGVGAVMVKATEGESYVNPWLKADADGAHAAGLQVGYYHFARPGQSSGSFQADAALTAIDGLPRQLGLALDLEVTEGFSWPTLAAWAQEFHACAKIVVEHSPLYVNDYFLANLPGAPFDWWLWLAQTARPRRQVWAWQEATPVVVPGIAGLTDVGWLYLD